MDLAKAYREKLDENKVKAIKTEKTMTDEIKYDINDTTFLERNILGFNKEYDLKLYNQKIK